MRKASGKAVTQLLKSSLDFRSLYLFMNPSRLFMHLSRSLSLSLYNIAAERGETRTKVNTVSRYLSPPILSPHTIVSQVFVESLFLGIQLDYIQLSFAKAKRSKLIKLNPAST